MGKTKEGVEQARRHSQDGKAEFVQQVPVVFCSAFFCSKGIKVIVLRVLPPLAIELGTG